MKYRELLIAFSVVVLTFSGCGKDEETIEDIPHAGCYGRGNFGDFNKFKINMSGTAESGLSGRIIAQEGDTVSYLGLNFSGVTGPGIYNAVNVKFTYVDPNNPSLFTDYQSNMNVSAFTIISLNENAITGTINVSGTASDESEASFSESFSLTAGGPNCL